MTLDLLGAENEGKVFQGRWYQRHTKVGAAVLVGLFFAEQILEAMLWLEGRRALDLGSKIRGLRNQ